MVDQIAASNFARYNNTAALCNFRIHWGNFEKRLRKDYFCAFSFGQRANCNVIV